MWIPATVILVIAAYAILTFNRLVKAGNRVQEAWSDIDVQLKRRYDLVPNLVYTVKEYTNHESSVFQNVARARADSMNAFSPERKGEAEKVLSEQIKTLIAVGESYPNLKAGTNFLELQQALVQIEDQIQFARRYYNGSVRDYNILIQTFPNYILAAMFGYEREPFFETELATERATPDVGFADKSGKQ